MQPAGVVESCLYVNDLTQAEQFYGEVLGLQVVTRLEGRHLFLRCGGQMVLLFIAAKSKLPGDDLPPHGAQGAGHLAFSVRLNELDSWKSRLTQSGVPIELDYQWPQGGRSLYFRDPAGNSLELTTPAIWGLPEPASK